MDPMEPVQAGLEAGAETPSMPETPEHVSAEADNAQQAEGGDAPQANAEQDAPDGETGKEGAEEPPKEPDWKAEADRQRSIAERASKAQQASDKRNAELQRQLQQPTADYELALALAKQVDDLRGDGLTAAQDQVKARQESVKQEVAQRGVLAQWESARDDMIAAIQEKGLAWNADELRDIREDWEGYVVEGRLTDARKLVRQVQRMESASPKENASPEPKQPPKPAKTPIQKQADLDVDAGGEAGGRGWDPNGNKYERMEAAIRADRGARR